MDRARTAIEGFRRYKQRQQPLSPQRPFVMLQTHHAPERTSRPSENDIKDIIVRQELMLRDKDLDIQSLQQTNASQEAKIKAQEETIQEMSGKIAQMMELITKRDELVEAQVLKLASVEATEKQLAV